MFVSFICFRLSEHIWFGTGTNTDLNKTFDLIYTALQNISYIHSGSKHSSYFMHFISTSQSLPPKKRLLSRFSMT